MSITKFQNFIPRDHLEEMTVTPFNFSKSSRQEKLVAERMAGDTLNLTILKNSKIAKKYTLVLESRPDFSVYENALTE